ncbi:hypothetical protein Ancab_026230 [Ancistrocladus abbreviatus]
MFGSSPFACVVSYLFQFPFESILAEMERTGSCGGHREVKDKNDSGLVLDEDSGLALREIIRWEVALQGCGTK